MADNDNLGIAIKLVLPPQSEIANAVKIINGNLSGQIKATINLIVDKAKVVQNAKQIRDIINQNLKAGNSINANVEVSKAQLQNIKQQIENTKAKINVGLDSSTLPEIKKIQDQFNSLKNLGGTIDFSKSKLLPDFEMSNSKITSLSNGIRNITQEYKLNDNQLLRVNGSYNTLKGTLDNISTTTENLRNKNINLTESINQALTKFPLWFGVSTAFVMALNQMRDAISYTVETNSIFTSLRMEMTDTALNFKEINKSALEFADQMGSTGDAVLRAIGIFGNYNSTLEQTLERSQAAILLSNLTGQSIQESADELLGTLTQYGMKDMGDSLKVVDLLSSVARNMMTDYPEAIKEVAKGINTVGSTAREAGVTVSSLAGQISALVDISRKSGTEVANSLKTIYSRMARIGEGEDPEQFKKLEKAMYDIGITMKSSADTIKPVDELLQELSERWSTLSDVQKNQLAQEAAGIYRRNMFLNLMAQYPKVLENTNLAINSQGVALQKEGIFLESLTSSLNKFKTAMQTAFSSSINANMLKTLIDMGTSSINVFNKLAETVGGLPAIIGVAVGAISLFSSKLREGIFTKILGQVNELKKLQESQLTPTFTFGNIGASIPMINNVKNSISGLITKFNEAKISLAQMGNAGALLNMRAAFEALKLSAAGSSIAIKGVQLATAGLQATLSLGLSIAITFLISKFMELAESAINYKQKQKEMFEQLRTNVASLNNELTESERLISVYTELSNKTTLLTEDKQRLSQAMERIATLFPSAISNFDAEGNVLSVNTQLLKEYIEQKKQDLDLKRQEITFNFNKQGNKDLATISKNTVSIGNYQRMLDDKEFSKNVADRYINAIKELRQESATAFQEIESGLMAVYQDDQRFRELGSSGLLLLIRAITKEAKDMEIKTAEGLQDVINKIADTSALNVAKTFQDKIKDFQSNKLGYEDLWKEQAKAVDQFNEALKSVGITDENVMRAIRDNFLSLPTKEATDKVIDFSMATNNLMESFSDVSKEISEYNQMLQTLNQNKKLNLEQVQNLISKYPQLLEAISIENGEMSISVEALEALKNVRVVEAQTAIRTQIAKSNIVSEETRARLRAFEIEIEGIQNLQDAYETFARYKSMADTEVSPETYDSAEYQRGLMKVQKQLYNYGTLMDKADKLAEMVGSSNFGLNLGESSTGAGSSYSGLIKKLETTIPVLEQVKNEYLESLDLLNNKINASLVIGTDIIKERYNLEEKYLNNLFDKRSNMYKQLIDFQAQQRQLEEIPTEDRNADWYETYNKNSEMIKQLTSDYEKLGEVQQIQLQNVQKYKSTLDSFTVPIENLNSITDNVISSIKSFGQDLRTQFINVIDRLQLNKEFGNNLFGKPSELASSLTSSLKSAMLEAKNLFSRQIPEVVAAKLAFITDAKSMKDVQKAKALLDEMYSDKRQIRLTLKDYNVASKLLEIKELLAELNKMEVKLAERKENQQDKINELEEELSELEEQEKVEQRQEQIEEKKLAILEKQKSVQEKINDLKKIEAEIDEVKADKRYELISIAGERTLTFDVEKVSDLEEQLADAQDAVDEANLAVVEAQQDYANIIVEINKEIYKEELQAEIDAANEKLDKMDENYEKKLQKWLEQHQGELELFIQNNSETNQLFTNDLQGRLDTYKTYLEEQRELYQVQVDDIYKATQAIIQAKKSAESGSQLVSIDFTKLTTSSNLQQQQTQQQESTLSLEQEATFAEMLKLQEEKQNSILASLKEFASNKLALIKKLDLQEIAQFIDQWNILHRGEIVKFNDLGTIASTGYNSLLSIYKSYMLEQRSLYQQSIKDAYEAGRKIAAALSAGKSGGNKPSARFDTISYNQVTYVPAAVTNVNSNQVTIVLNQSQSDAVMSTISSYLPAAIRSNS